MTSGGKILLGLLAIGGITLAVFHSGEAHADQSPPPPNPLPPLPNPLVPPLGSVLPPAGTPIPIPGGGSIPTPSIPGVNTPPTSVTPLPPPLVVPMPPSTSPFPTLPAPGTSIPLPGGGAVPVPVIPGLNAPGVAQLPPLVVTPGPAAPAGAPPASSAELPGMAPADTLALVTSMLRDEANPHWRIIPNAALKPWQASRHRPADGAFGTGDALALAQEIGTIPIIRAWPKGSFPGDGKLDNYRASLQQIANAASEPRASQLRASAARETGQGYGTPEKPILHLITIQS